MTPKQLRFVDEYLIDLNATQAAIRAGYSAKMAGRIGFQLLEKTRIQQAIQARQAARSARTEITQDRVLKELSRIGFFDIRKLVNDDGSPKPITDLDDDTAAALAGLDIVMIGNDTVGVGTVLKFKIAGKVAALELMGRHLALFTDKMKVDICEVGPDWNALVGTDNKKRPSNAA